MQMSYPVEAKPEMSADGKCVIRIDFRIWVWKNKAIIAQNVLFSFHFDHKKQKNLQTRKARIGIIW